MHLDADQVQRVLHGELAASSEAAVREHLNSCATCRARVADAQQDERELHGLLRALDHAPPAISAQTVLGRARVKQRAPLALRWAAGLLLAFGVSSAAYAIPGSPVRGWVDAVGRLLAGVVEAPSVPNAPSVPAAQPAGPGATAGIAVAPGRELIVAFTSSFRAEVRVTLVDTPSEVVVLAPTGAATFTADGERLEIVINGPTARIDVRIPRAAPRVEILVNGSRRLLKVAARVTTPGAEAPVEPYVLTIAPDR